MADIKITDLVPQETIDELKNLDKEMQNIVDSFTNTAKELAKGLQIEVKVIGDIDKLDALYNQKAKEAEELTKRLNTALEKKDSIIANTTNTISRQLMEQERVNKTQRETYTDTNKFYELMDQVNGSYGERIKRLAQLELELKKAKDQEKALGEDLKKNLISHDTYIERMSEAKMKTRELMQEKSKLDLYLKNEEKEMMTVEGSYNNLSQRLALMRRAYQDFTDEEKASPLGKEMEKAIQDLDAHLKDLDADMGQFQRNVGNYAIAGKDGVVSTESLIAALEQEAVTTQDLIDQTKILEEAKLRLNTGDANYEQTLASLNAKIDENKARLMDVSDILSKDATSAAEAEAQNKRLQEAMKHIDLTADGAQERIDELNAKIEKNKELIDAATPSTEKLAKAEAELAKKSEEASRTNQGLADQMLSLIGVNSKFGSSLTNLQVQGNVFEGLKTKVDAFGNALTGLLANPYVLALLGIAGVAAGFKWWYDYNKGLIEASKSTANFTGATGEMADKVTADMTALSDALGSDYNETMKAANTLVQQYGISWGEAMELMEDGYQAGANVGENMVANIQKFGPALRDAGVSADEFMAILSNTRNGIFDEKGVQDIVKGGTRLRSMTKSLAADLDAAGISSKQMQKDMAEGNITTMEAIQQVAEKLKELPENSQLAGKIMKDVFGRTAAEGGTLLIQSIADVNTNLEECKDNMGEMGRLNREQLDAQKELQETMQSVFKMSGTSFQELTTKAKTFVAKGITKIIQGLVDIVNWFIRIYNKSIVVRGAVTSIVNCFKTLWEVVKLVFKDLVDIFKGVGTVIEGIFTFNWEKIKQGITNTTNALKKNIGEFVNNIVSNAKKAINEVTDGTMNEITIGYNADPKELNNGAGGETRTGENPKTPDEIAAEEKKKKADEKAAKAREKQRAKEKKEADKQAKEELKRIQALEDAKIAMMEEGHDKDIALIRQKFKKKLDEIKGNSATETALRVQLTEECEKEIADYEKKYQKELAKINLENRLAAVEEGSEEEYRLKAAKLEQEYQMEREAAKKTGADVAVINEKYEKEKLKLKEDYANKWVQKAMERNAQIAADTNNEYMATMVMLKKQLNEELKLAGDNLKKREELQEEFDRNMAALNQSLIEDTLTAEIEMLEKLLEMEELSAAERLRIDQELTAKRLELADKTADYQKETNEDTRNSTQKWLDKNLDMIDTFASAASDMLNSITELVSTIYDAQISKIEEEQEANQAAFEQESELISELVSKKVISEEEGEARKRAAEAQTAKKEEELAKKKRDLQIKQAKWDKANSIAQATISTALAVMNALQTQPFWLGIAMAAIAGAMGAVQIATIAATPIPAYKEGTDYHKGGLAIVGDGGRQEVVKYNGLSWLTPDTPTLMELPKGASVLPSIEEMSRDLVKLPDITVNASQPMAMKTYDDKAIRRALAENNSLLRSLLKQQHADAQARKFEIYKSTI